MQLTKEMVFKLLDEKIQMAKRQLDFWEIAESASGVGFEYNESWNPFCKEEGAPLCGRRVYKDEISFETLLDGKGFVSTTIEIFLTESGELMKFQTIEETRICSIDGSKDHLQLQRMMDEDQSIAEDELQVILFNITLLISYYYQDEKDSTNLAVASEESGKIWNLIWG